MISDGSYHEEETISIANVEIQNFLESIGWKYDKEKIEEFVKSRYKDFLPYLDEEGLTQLVLFKLQG